MSSQAALAIALMRASRPYHWGYRHLFDESSLLGLELDDVLLGADPAPPLFKGETKYRHWVRQQKEAAREIAAREEAAAQERAVWEEEWRVREAKRQVEEAQRKVAAEEWRVAWEAKQLAEREERRAAQEERRVAEAHQRELALAKRWAARAGERAIFEDRFSVDFMKVARQHGSVFDLCLECHNPFWILYENLVNWSRYWKGPLRCLLCYCPPLTARIRRENPTWSSARVAHETITAICGSGAYAWAPELVAQARQSTR